MSLDSLKTRIEKRNDYYKNKKDFSDIGSFIKRKRKELKITQDEVSEGICSISYLSKIENNQIVPSEFYVRELMDKLEVDESVYSNSLKEKDFLEKTLEAFYYMNDELMRSIYQDIKGIEHNSVINLCKLGYITYFKHEDHEQYVMMLEHLINNMTDLEVSIYLYFSSVYFMYHQQYRLALELVQLSEGLNTSNEMVKALFYENSCYIKQKLLIKNSASEDYHQALSFFTRNHNTKRIINLAFLRVENTIEENPKKAQTIISSIKESQLDNQELIRYNYMAACAAKANKRYKDATLYLNKIPHDSDFYYKKMVLLLEICSLDGDENMMDEIVSILEEYSPSSTNMSQKVYYHYLSTREDEERKEYLRTIAIPFSIKAEDYKTLKIYIDDVMDICIQNSRYKEAIGYYKKYQKEMERIKRILS